MCVHRQLILIMELYSHDDVYNYLRQIALTLCSDKVSEVRWISYQLVGMTFGLESFGGWNDVTTIFEMIV